MRYRKMFQYFRIAIAAMFLVVIYTVQVCAGSGGSEPSSSRVTEEPAIFARVLKETLESAGMADFLAGPFGVRSPIETGIQSDYIPTIGLLVRVPVSFPISAPAEREVLKETERDSSDLWEKYSKSGSLAERRSPVVKLERKLNTREHVALDPGLMRREEIRIEGPDNIHISADRDEEDDAGKFFVERLAPKLNIMINGFGAAPYDESRVTKLREAILDVIAQYGNRVSSVQEGERIIVVVEAPAPEGAARVLIGNGDDEPRRDLGPFYPRLDGKEERMLIAVPRSAVASASTRDAIAPQVTEKRY